MRLARLFSILFASFLLAPTMVMARQPSSPWQLVDERRIEVAGTPYALSPDAQWLAGPGVERGTFCIWDVEALDETCSPAFTPMIAPASIRWSPDSSAVAFGMHASSSEMRSDIYLYEVETGVFTNLTELQTGTPGDEPGETWHPHYWNPVWSPESDELALTEIVHHGDGMQTVRLVSIPRSGGELTELAMLGSSDSIVANGPAHWREDGTITYTIWHSDDENPDNGIWQMTPDGHLAQAAVADKASGFWLPYLTDVSKDGTRASVYSLGAYAYDDAGPGKTWFLVDLETGGATPWETLLGLDLDPERAERLDGTGILAGAPIFSPDGTSAAFMTRREDRSVDIGVMHDDGSVEILTALPAYAGSLADNPMFLAGTGPNLVWADDNTLLAMTSYNAVLLTLER